MASTVTAGFCCLVLDFILNENSMKSSPGMFSFQTPTWRFSFRCSSSAENWTALSARGLPMRPTSMSFSICSFAIGRIRSASA